MSLSGMILLLPALVFALAATASSQPRVELFNKNIRAIPVPVCYDDLVRARIEGAADRSVHIVGHELAEAGVLGVPGRDLVPGSDAGDTFHIGGDQDLHGDFSSIMVVFAICRSTSLPSSG